MPKLKTFKFQFIERYEGEVEAKNLDKAHDLVREELDNNSNNYSDGGELIELEEVKNK